MWGEGGDMPGGGWWWGVGNRGSCIQACILAAAECGMCLEMQQQQKQGPRLSLPPDLGFQRGWSLQVR